MKQVYSTKLKCSICVTSYQWQKLAMDGQNFVTTYQVAAAL